MKREKKSQIQSRFNWLATAPQRKRWRFCMTAEILPPGSRSFSSAPAPTSGLHPSNNVRRHGYQHRFQKSRASVGGGRSHVLPPRVRKEGASMCHKTIKKKKHLLYGVVIAVSIVLLLSGILAASRGKPLLSMRSFRSIHLITVRNETPCTLSLCAKRMETGSSPQAALLVTGKTIIHPSALFRSRLRMWKDSLRSFVKQTRSRGSGDIASRFGHVLSIYPMRRRAVPG